MQDTYIGDEGNGFPLVLVHGFLGSSKMWKPQQTSENEGYDFFIVKHSISLQKN